MITIVDRQCTCSLYDRVSDVVENGIMTPHHGIDDNKYIDGDSVNDFIVH